MLAIIKCFPAAILAIISIQGVVGCPDRSALNKVDVWVHRDIRARGEALPSININELDKYKMIDVTKANVSILCDGMVKMFPKLEHLSLVNANITDIQPEAFQQLPRITHLSLAVNNLTQIKRASLKNLQSLKVLFLSSNKIEDIEADAFADLPNVEKIAVDRNRLHQIHPDWFRHNPRLVHIDLSFNLIYKLQSGAFTLPHQVTTTQIRLNNNYIDTIETKAVTPYKDPANQDNDDTDKKPYLILHLQRNHIKTISAEFIESIAEQFNGNLIINANLVECISDEVLEVLFLTRIGVHLTQNPISCDCMTKLDKYIAQHALIATFYYNTTLGCEENFWNPPPQLS